MSNQAPKIDHNQLLEVMKAFAFTNKPLLIWGPPGSGKSASVAAFTQSIGGLLCDIRLAMYDAVDMRGLPDVDADTGRTIWRPVDTLPLVGSSWPTDKPVVLFLDELLQAPQVVQSVAFQLVHDRKVGEHGLLPNVIVVGATNRETDRAGVNKMLTPLANRFRHVEVVPTLDGWKPWAMSAGIHSLVLAYLNFRPQHLDGFEQAQKTGAKAFPTSRTWEGVSDLLHAYAKPDEAKLRDVLILSTIGEAVGTEFNAFTQSAELLPAYEDISGKPEKVAIPDTTEMLYAVSSMLVVRTKPQDVDSVLTYIRRLPAEYQTMWMADISQSRPELVLESKEMMQMQTDLHNAIQG